MKVTVDNVNDDGGCWAIVANGLRAMRRGPGVELSSLVLDGGKNRGPREFRGDLMAGRGPTDWK